MPTQSCDQALSDAQGDLAYFTRLYDHAPVGYCVISEAGVILQANFKAAALLGIQRDDLIHRRLARFILHEGQEEFYRLRRRTEESGRPEACELWMVRSDSSAFWAHLQFTFVAGHQESQRSSIIQLVLTDATERMHASAKLRESEERFKFALEATRDGLWDFNLKSNKVYFSPQWFKLLGYQDEPLIDDVNFFFGLIHPDDMALVQSSLAEHLIGNTPVKQVEVRLRTKSGEYRWFSDKGEIVSWDDEGRPERMVGTLTDITERKLAEEALQESEYRWKFAIEGSGDGLWDWNIASGNVYYSKRWMGMLGFAEQEVTDTLRYWEERIHPDDQADVLAKTKAHLRGETPSYRNEQRVLCKDGTWKWILARGMVVSRDASGRPLRMIGTHTDVSDRKQADEALRASEERYRKLFERNPQPMWVYDIESLCVLAVNEKAVESYGYSHAEFLSMTIAELIPPQDSGLQATGISLSGPLQGQDGVCRHVLKNGQIIHVEISSHSLEFAARKARMVLAQNITERLLAEQRIRQQATLLDKAQDAILVHDLNHKILYWNQSAERLYQWKAAEALNQSVELLLYRDSSDFAAVMNATLAKGEWVGEIRQVSKDRTILTVEGRWTLLYDELNQPSSVLAIYTDITERKKLEQQFLRAQRMESIGTLAGGIAHDLNNVLAPIMMSIDLLKNYMQHPRGLEILEMIGASTRRGADMVHQVLSFARGLEGKRIHLPIHHLFQELVSISGETFPKNILIETQLCDDLWTVEADPTQLHQVLLNLCVNARDAMPGGGKILLRASNAVIDSHYSAMNLEQNLGNYLLLEVEDSGIGMTQDVLEEIFDPFFTTKEVGKGTGLGLSSVMAIVKSHGGFIRVSSEPAVGSRFMIYLPAVVELTAPGLPPVAEDLPRGQGEMILVVDDELAIREVAKSTLEAHGYQVVLAENGSMALDVFLEMKGAIRLVLTDMMMPIMDGPTLIGSLKRLDSQVKIIGASGMADHDLVKQAMASGVDDFLSKPFSLASLLGALSRALAR